MQFIRQLRFVAYGVPATASRHSNRRGGMFDYERVLVNQAAVRNYLLWGRRRAPELGTVEKFGGVLAETLARVEVESATTIRAHPDLWRDYGSNLASPFSEVKHTVEDIEYAEEFMKQRLQACLVKKRAHMQRKLDLSRDDTSDDGLPDEEVALGMGKFVVAATDIVREDLKKFYGTFAPVWEHLIRENFLKNGPVQSSSGRLRGSGAR